MDTWRRVETGAPTISSEERLVSKDKELGYMIWDKALKLRFLKILLQPKFVDVGIFRYTGWEWH
jgi:hypothetical protein